ncbi:esterase family protein [Paenibacillus sonchi]|uniref:Esterase family protein n=1 Tax=Paenibacillus sonchi TaxID=373687 RepID=A0A974P8W8_9BACL|nr:alpha/beta hydrolase-fold protein [Paenibacillus sonchi]QQZ59549.1 esterase family protein [Paenibacillus sonchi]
MKEKEPTAVQPAPTLEGNPAPDETKGTVSIEKLGERRIFVYLPPGYETGKDRYPVVYMNDGRSVFNTGTSSFNKEWLVDKKVDQLVNDGKMEKVIVIAVDASEGSDRGKEYVPFPNDSIPTDGTGAEEFTSYFIETVIPFADSTYRTIPDRDHRMIMGSSFGGVQAFWMGYHHPETFSMIGALSASTWVANGQAYDDWVQETGKPDVKIWLDMGAEEGMVIDPLVDLLLSKGFKYGQDLFFQMDPIGEHDEISWSRRVHSPLIMFAGKAPGQAVKLEVSDYLSISGMGDSYLRVNPVATMDNGMDYSVPSAASYKVLNPEVGQVDPSGKVTFLKHEDLRIEVTYQGITQLYDIENDR